MRVKLFAILMASLFASNAYAVAEVGKPAPDFTGTSAEGKTVKLADYKGKIVVLEWNNPDCPFVKKFYSSGTMQKLQAAETQNGVVWLTINSSARGTQGYMENPAALEYVKKLKAAPTAYLLDHRGRIGYAYIAKVTPHMYVIDSNGILAYAGAMDDKPGVDPADLAKANNYVSAAINALRSGKTPTVTSTQAYGCSVKY